MGSWKAGSPTSNPLLLKAQSRQQFIGLQQSHGTTESTITALQQILEATTPWPNPLLLCIRHVFSTFFCSCNEGMGMMQPQRNAELANALPLSGTQASGREWRLRFHKRIKRHGFLDKHVQQISFRQCVAFCEHGQLKGWQPHFQPTVAKSSISTTVHWFAAVTWHNWEHNHQSLHCNKSWRPQLRDKTLCFSA